MDCTQVYCHYEFSRRSYFQFPNFKFIVRFTENFKEGRNFVPSEKKNTTLQSMMMIPTNCLCHLRLQNRKCRSFIMFSASRELHENELSQVTAMCFFLWCAWDIIVTHICHDSLADMVQMFSSVLVATHTHECEQLQEEASGKRRRTEQPSRLSLWRLSLLPCGDDSRFCRKAWRTAGGSCPGVPHWRWQSERRGPQERCSRLTLGL